LRLPTDGWSPLIAAAGTAGFFLLLTVGWIVPAFACGLIAIVAILHWLWGSDQSPPEPTAMVADGVRLPVGAVGRASHSWWAVIVLIAVDITIFASLVFAHLHVSMAAEVCPPPGASLPDAGWPLTASLLLVIAVLLMADATRCLRRGEPRMQRGLRARVALATASVAVAFGLDLGGHLRSGLDPTAEAWSATIGALLGYHGFHAAVLLLMGGYVLVRSWRGRLRPDARATLDNTLLMFCCVAAQGAIAAVVVQIAPRWAG